MGCNYGSGDDKTMDRNGGAGNLTPPPAYSNPSYSYPPDAYPTSNQPPYSQSAAHYQAQVNVPLPQSGMPVVCNNPNSQGAHQVGPCIRSIGFIAAVVVIFFTMALIWILAVQYLVPPRSF